eukprot:snap_masked-scaffold_1-processed-gene-0.32-mRNA-1 protein AED:1.00 eAED:1.00 QI:0/-1/0/0/-1/1/1/0/82
MNTESITKVTKQKVPDMTHDLTILSTVLRNSTVSLAEKRNFNQNWIFLAKKPKLSKIKNILKRKKNKIKERGLRANLYFRFV